MSDWWGGADAVAQMNAGNDLLMPGCYQREELLKALKNKSIDEKVINRNLERILNYILLTPRFKGYKYSYQPDLAAHGCTENKAQNVPNFIIELLGGKLAFMDEFEVRPCQVVIVVGVGGACFHPIRPRTEFKVKPVGDGLTGIVNAAPVGNHSSIKSPFVS